MSNIKYKVATINDLGKIADTHISCFPDYFISSLGKKLVEKYYLEFIKENDLFIVAEDNGRVIGFCMGYIIDETRARDKFIHNNTLALTAKMIKQCLALNRKTISKCYGFLTSKIKKRQKSSIEKHGGDLLSICVLEEYRGRGISSELVDRFELKLLEKDQKEYWLGVYKTNEAAIRFYKKMGMRIESEDTEEYKFHKFIRRVGQ